jgi:hypothetical protein
MKMGSAWWLLHGEITEDVFHLSLLLPESNFNQGNAILHSMLCSFATTVFTIGYLNAGMYGYILHNPDDGMHVNSLFALCIGPLSTMWKM